MEIMHNPVKRVAAIHDLSGFGRASLTVVTPILSCMGVQVCPLPTAVLSTHSKFKDYHFVDLTDHLLPIIEHWERLNLQFDGIYSGFLGSFRQIEIVSDFIRRFRTKQTLVVVDPVMGDDGVLYGPMTPEIVSGMRQMISLADIITPNITEAAFLLGRPMPELMTEGEVKRWLLDLAELGPQIVIITSVPDQREKRHTSVYAYNKSDNRFWRVTCTYLPAAYPGTGDAFASVLTGALLQGDSLPMAIDRAVAFASLGVRASFGYGNSSNEGILLERILPSLQMPVQPSSYELIEN
ncbi:pyridoxine kinase [Williamwhitmania taraxaci]|uniref:pyridoxal kinase n=1 Tax=Williamwhitmania taraxaci TaxID=1640674 RepID=A0A1G6RMF5_9BACT|nr:pyridoxine kinase [Williamwhitmania taraxaci]